jgi:hypothetical protein
MSRPRLLCLLSSDFGEYVTASLLVRAQPFDAHFALPEALARFVPPGSPGHSAYRSFAELEALVAAQRPDVVLLASGYLFAVNRIAPLEALAGLVRTLRRSRTAVATTDPWLRVWALRPQARYAIHSVAKGGVDAETSARMDALQRELEALLGGLPHLFAVPLADAARRWLAFYNPQFAERARALRAKGDGWLFVLSREDYVLLAGFERQAFFAALERRLRELLARGENRVRFVAPPEVVRFLSERFPGEPRLACTSFCDFARFEALVREAQIVAYWNVISSSLLYCLYYGVPPVFFGAGHLVKVCPGLDAHAAEHVYRGRPPRLLALDEPLAADPGALIGELGLQGWVEDIRREYEQAPPPPAAIAAIRAAA